MTSLNFKHTSYCSIGFGRSTFQPEKEFISEFSVHVTLMCSKKVIFPSSKISMIPEGITKNHGHKQ